MGPAGALFESEKDAVHDETWIVAVRADADEGAYSGESPVIASVKVDCPRPTLFLYTECADRKLNIEIDNSNLESRATFIVTELLPDDDEGTPVYGPENLDAGFKVTVPIEFAYGATYTVVVSGPDGALYQPVEEEIVVFSIP